MFEREGGEARTARRGVARPAEIEVLLERAVGEPLLVTPPEGEARSHLRPQNGRNVVWRWHVRRRQRSG